MATPQVSLEQALEVFSSPEKFIRVQETMLRLNKMGIKIDAAVAQPCNTLRLTEVCIGDQPPRVVTLAKFPREEFLSRPFCLNPAISIPLATM